jgi:hypothetical protein
MENKIAIDEKNHLQFKNNILLSIKQDVNDTSYYTRKENEMKIYVRHPKIINIIDKLQLFPKELTNIVDEYITDGIFLKYSICSCVSINMNLISTNIKFHITGNLYCDNIDVKYNSQIHVDILKINDGNSNIQINNKTSNIQINNDTDGIPFSFINEIIHTPDKSYELYYLPDDHISFLNYYMEKKFNKKNYLKYHTTNAHYGKIKDNFSVKIIFIDQDEQENKIKLDITRTITNEHHLLVCSKIIRIMETKIHGMYIDISFIDYLKNIISNNK